MKFILVAEGHTEEQLPAFIKRWLDPRLTRRVGIQLVRLPGWGAVESSISDRTRAYLEGPLGNEIIAVVGLLDLYGPDFYPDQAGTVQERYDWAVRYIEARVNHPKFRMFFAVHEIEAWILSQPEIFPRPVAERVPDRPPETINFDEPPSKLLNRLYHASHGKGYVKPADGRRLFAKLDPSIAASKCPHLDAMLQELLSMAKAAGL